MSIEQKPDRLSILVEYLARVSEPDKEKPQKYSLETIVSCIANLAIDDWDIKKALGDGYDSDFERPYDINSFYRLLTKEDIQKNEFETSIDYVDERLSTKFMNANLKQLLDEVTEVNLRRFEEFKKGIELSEYPEINRDW